MQKITKITNRNTEPFRGKSTAEQAVEHTGRSMQASNSVVRLSERFNSEAQNERFGMFGFCFERVLNNTELSLSSGS